MSRNHLIYEKHTSDGLNYVQSSIAKTWTHSNLFDVQKNDVRVCSLSNVVNLVKALLGSKFDVRLFKAKNKVFQFDCK